MFNVVRKTTLPIRPANNKTVNKLAIFVIIFKANRLMTAEKTAELYLLLSVQTKEKWCQP